MAGTRIPVWLLEAFRREGVHADALASWYPTLTASGIAAAFRYASAHPAEIGRSIKENAEA